MAQVHAAASGDATVARAPVDDVTTMQPPGDEAALPPSTSRLSPEARHRWPSPPPVGSALPWRRRRREPPALRHPPSSSLRNTPVPAATPLPAAKPLPRPGKTPLPAATPPPCGRAPSPPYAVLHISAQRARASYVDAGGSCSTFRRRGPLHHHRTQRACAPDADPMSHSTAIRRRETLPNGSEQRASAPHLEAESPCMKMWSTA